jgi:hypothetical protein
MAMTWLEVKEHVADLLPDNHTIVSENRQGDVHVMQHYALGCTVHNEWKKRDLVRALKEMFVSGQVLLQKSLDVLDTRYPDIIVKGTTYGHDA